MKFLDLQSLPPLSIVNGLRIIASDGGFWDIPATSLEAAYKIDPGLRLIPGSDFNVLVLTASDGEFLREMEILVPQPYLLTDTEFLQQCGIKPFWSRNDSENLVKSQKERLLAGLPLHQRRILSGLSLYQLTGDSTARLE
jgi:hypothetical protein